MSKLRAVIGARVKVFQDSSEHSGQWVIIGRKPEYDVGKMQWVDKGYHLQNQETGHLSTLYRHEFEVVGNIISEQMEQSVALFEIEED